MFARSFLTQAIYVTYVDLHLLIRDKMMLMHCLDDRSCCQLLLFFLLAFFLTAVSMLVLLQDIGAAGVLPAQV